MLLEFRFCCGPLLSDTHCTCGPEIFKGPEQLPESVLENQAPRPSAVCLVVMGDELTQDALQMPLVQRNQVVQALAPNRANHSLAIKICYRAERCVLFPAASSESGSLALVCDSLGDDPLDQEEPAPAKPLRAAISLPIAFLSDAARALVATGNNSGASVAM